MNEDDSKVSTWKPEVGDQLVGKLVAYKQAETKFGKGWIAMIEVEANADHEAFLQAVFLGAVLRSEFAKLKPQVGERIGLRRLADSDNAKRYHRFRVVVDRSEPETSVPNWDAEETSGAADVPF